MLQVRRNKQTKGLFPLSYRNVFTDFPYTALQADLKTVIVNTMSLFIRV